MKIGNSNVYPVHTVYQDCGLDGNSGPVMTETVKEGITLRQHYAGLAMQGFIQSGKFDFDIGSNYERMAIRSTKAADALLAALEVEQ